MKNKWFYIVAMVMVMVVILAACKPAAEPTVAAEEPAVVAEEPAAEEPEAKNKVAALFPGQIYDRSWVQAGYEQLERAKTDCNLDVAYTESVAQPEQAEVFRNYAQQGYNIVIGYGGEFHDAAASVAKDFPDVNFVLVNSKVADGDNVSSSVVNYFGPWYLSGVLACNMTKTDKVAMLMGEELPHLKIGETAYEMGAQTCGKTVEVKSVYVGSWTDVNKAKEAAQALIDEGFDVIKHHIDTADVGLFSAAEDAGIYTIGAYRDQQDISPKSIIGSTIGAPAQMYGAACGSYLDGEVHEMTLANGADFVVTDLATDEAKAAVEKAKQDLLDGKITPPAE